MRLTLRTLLAHLDNTLEADDNASIAAKLRESEFAANLVRRITASIANESLGAPSPTSTSTVDDANRIGEYLDSVLSSEQVTEIERVCLESDSHLAEVAACHQILTLVLGNPAEIPPALRTQMYGLIKQQPSDRFDTNGTVYSHDAGLTNDTLGETRKETEPGRGIVAPVGLDESGVFNAVTRLKKSTDDLKPESPVPSSTQTRRMQAAELSEYSGRSSRVVPWLVSLALVASFLFVASQAFAPLLQRRAAKQVADADVVVRESILEVEDEYAPPMVEPVPVTPVVPASPGIAAAETSETPSTTKVDSLAKPAAPVAIVPARDLLDEVMPDDKPIDDAPVDEGLADAKEQPSVAPEPLRASLVSDGSLFLVQKPNDLAYQLAKKDDPIPMGSELVCPPLYRDRVRIAEQLDITMIGPAKMKLDQSQSDAIDLTASIGRFLLQRPNEIVVPTGVEDAGNAIDMRTDASTVLNVDFDNTQHRLELIGPEAIAALDIVHRRLPGSDPEDPASSSVVLELLAVDGELRWSTDGEDDVIVKTGEFVQWSTTNQFLKLPLDTIPPWIEPVAEVAGSLNTSASEGLLALVRGNESIEISLREAIDYRRAEVGALATQTLILIDRPEVCFGGAGVLSNVSQKAFWENHFDSLVSMLSHGPESASNIRAAIKKMDATAADAIYRLLWLYSNEQLEAGADTLLVTSLDDPTMAVRVLAAENLRQITGTTLMFKPENETAPRRSSDIKKWEIRLRKKDVRWPEPRPARATDEPPVKTE